LKDDIEIESILIKAKEDLEKYKQVSNIHEKEAENKQRLRDEIWSLINIYFSFLEQDFRKYTMIELNHKSDLELNPETLHSREDKI
jgi:hypothetical protein